MTIPELLLEAEFETPVVRVHKPVTKHLKKGSVEGMIVVMKNGATSEEISAMAQRVESLGLKAHVIEGTERTVIAAVGEKRENTKEALAAGAGVAEIVPILAPYKVASKEVKPEPTSITAGSLVVGGNTVGMIGGPCSVESEEQLMQAARAVKAAGGTGLRGGAFKPRPANHNRAHQRPHHKPSTRTQHRR